MSAAASKLVILDRDGVINEDSDAYIKSLKEWIPIDGSIDAIAKLSKAGYQVVVATNQSGIARGYFDLETLQQMHDQLCQLVENAGGKVAGIFYCPHGPDDHCDCRKPKAGLIKQIEAALALPALGAVIVGDSLRDLDAGRTVGCIPYLVKTGKGQLTLDNGKGLEDVVVFENLATVAEHIISQGL